MAALGVQEYMPWTPNWTLVRAGEVAIKGAQERQWS